MRCVVPQQTSAGGRLKVLGIVLIILGGVIYVAGGLINVASGGDDENPSAFLALPLIIGGILLH